jgi:DNA-binding CsgD family transcriptional regulator
MKNIVVDAKGQQLLELLAEGASTLVLARKLGYSPGTVRVYLHNLYRVIGVRNRTEAVLWHLNRVRPAGRGAVAPSRPLADDTFGDVALRDGLLGALGVMESFIGPYGRVWEVGLRLKGGDLDEQAATFRDDARLLWRALLQGNFGYGKSLHEEGLAERLLNEAPSEALLLVALLLVGGYSHAADACIAQLSRARKAGQSPSARELAFLRALRSALYDGDAEAVASLNALAGEKSSPGLRQVVLVALFHVHRGRKDGPRARDVANVIWGEAESAREQLEAMGIRPLAREASLPRAAKAGAREKVAAER